MFIGFFKSTLSKGAVGEDVFVYSKILWNELSKRSDYEVEKIESVWGFLSDEQTEDLLFLYLQYNGWFVIPNSRKKDTMAYEYYCINRLTFEKAIVQVKTGFSPIDFNAYHKYTEKVFLLQPNNCFQGEPLSNMEMVSIEALESFAKNNEKIIPQNIMTWFKLVNTQKI